MIHRLLCRLLGHSPLAPGTLWGSCHRSGALIRAPRNTYGSKP